MGRLLTLAVVLAVTAALVSAKEGDACFHRRLKKGGRCRQLSDCPAAPADLRQQCAFRRGDPAATVCCAAADAAPEAAAVPVAPGDKDRALPCYRVLQEVTDSDAAVEARSRGPPGTVARAMCQQYSRHSCAKKKAAFAFDDVTVEDFCESVNKTDQLIVGGRVARDKEFPHMALLGYGERRADIQYLCGGTLVSPRYVLTAAHCVYSGSTPVRWALLGTRERSDGGRLGGRPQLIPVAEHVKHPEYKPPLKYHDIALLRLARDVRFEAGFVRPACLDTEGGAEERHSTATATGWGLTEWEGEESSLLMTVTMNMTALRSCQRTYGTNSHGIPRGILESQVCAGSPGKDSCEGDSGGPLQAFPTRPYCMFHVLGIVSFGQFCGFNTPGVYTRVSHYVAWIESIVWPSGGSTGSGQGHGGGQGEGPPEWHDHPPEAKRHKSPQVSYWSR